jgi:hypothetical protein
MTNSDIISVCNIAPTVFAVIAAPMVALWSMESSNDGLQTGKES